MGAGRLDPGSDAIWRAHPHPASSLGGESRTILYGILPCPMGERVVNDGVSILKPSSLAAFPDTVLDRDFSILGSFLRSKKPPESELFRGEG